jgi:hypothetical protein
MELLMAEELELRERERAEAEASYARRFPMAKAAYEASQGVRWCPFCLSRMAMAWL